MNTISKLRRDISARGVVNLDIETFNDLQKEWILRTMNKEVAKKMATDFYYWWHNQEGTNTQQGFDDWWEANQ